LLLGIPLYGPTWTLTSSNTAIGASGTPSTFLPYSQICLNIRNNGWTRVFDTNQMAPYAFGNNRWVGYDDAQSIINKITYLNDNGLGGAFFWEISMDDYCEYFFLNFVQSLF
jgi:chitinase